jgi:hypothetical protein
MESQILFSFCPPAFLVFTEVLQEFRRDITRNVWTFLRARPSTRLRRGKPRITDLRLRSYSESVRELSFAAALAGLEFRIAGVVELADALD